MSTSEPVAILQQVPTLEEVRRRLEQNEAERRALRRLFSIAQALQQAQKPRGEAVHA